MILVRCPYLSNRFRDPVLATLMNQLSSSVQADLVTNRDKHWIATVCRTLQSLRNSKEIIQRTFKFTKTWFWERNSKLICCSLIQQVLSISRSEFNMISPKQEKPLQSNIKKHEFWWNKDHENITCNTIAKFAFFPFFQCRLFVYVWILFEFYYDYIIFMQFFFFMLLVFYIYFRASGEISFTLIQYTPFNVKLVNFNLVDNDCVRYR